MRFHDIVWFWGLLAIPVLGVLAWVGVSRQTRAIHRFVSRQTAPRLLNERVFTLRRITSALLAASMALLVLALARPQYGVKPVMLKRSGIDVMIAIDTSKSMNARDIAPSRIERARNEIKKLIPALEGNRLGLIAFAGRSFVECPLTLDTSTVRLFLDTINVGSIPVPGTAIGGAIRDAVKAFKVSKAKTKAVILVTDGENLEGEVEEAATLAKENGIAIFPIGIGLKGGAPIPEVDKAGNITRYKTDKDGNTIISRLDTETLHKIAELTGGFLVTFGGEGEDIALLIDHLSKMDKSDITSQEFTEYEERFQWLLAAALLLLLLEYVFVSRRQASETGTA